MAIEAYSDGIALIKPIKSDFHGILPPFDLWGPFRQILMVFCPLFSYGAKGLKSKGPKGLNMGQNGSTIFIGSFALLIFEADFVAFSPLLFSGAYFCVSKGPKGRDFILVPNNCPSA